MRVLVDEDTYNIEYQMLYQKVQKYHKTNIVRDFWQLFQTDQCLKWTVFLLEYLVLPPRAEKHF